MILFVVGNMLLKVKRSKIPRPVIAGWGSLFFALLAVSVALVGNGIMNPPYLIVFLEYFTPALIIVAVMQWRIGILKGLFYLINKIAAKLIRPLMRLKEVLRLKMEEINSQQVVFFTRGDNIANLNSVMLYVKHNEHTNNVKMVFVKSPGQNAPERLAHDVEFLDDAYPDINIQFIEEEGEFSPELVHQLSRKWDIPPNFMFIGCPSGELPFGLADFGGVRVIA